MHINLEAIQTVQLGEILVRHSTANLDGNAGEFRHSSIFGKCLTYRWSANILGNVDTNLK